MKVPEGVDEEVTTVLVVVTRVPEANTSKSSKQEEGK